MKIKSKCIKYVFSLLVSFICLSCIDPVEPEFDFTDDLIFIDAYASSANGASYVIINKTEVINNRYTNSFISGATVSFKNILTNEIITLTEENEIYLPSENFSASVGDIWELNITLADGRTYKSIPETLLEPVPISQINATYDSELLFNEATNDYSPGHSINISFTDPADNENYYYWRYKSYEKQVYCLKCPQETIYRDGECRAFPDTPGLLTYDYQCESDCWRIRFNENFKIFSDKFSNGNLIDGLAVADVFLYSKEDIVVELEQFSLSESAYQYYKVLKDLVDNNGSINAPPPAALLGNMFNPNNTEEFVLGRFTAASTSNESIFIDRTEISENIIGREVFRRLEGCEVCPPDTTCGFGCTPVLKAPCEETRFSTSIEPEGWIDQ